ncbi:hypothetical protein AB0H95_26205, partial [Streptomyces sp. NPDC051014]
LTPLGRGVAERLLSVVHFVESRMDEVLAAGGPGSAGTPGSAVRRRWRSAGSAGACRSRCARCGRGSPPSDR